MRAETYLFVSPHLFGNCPQLVGMVHIICLYRRFAGAAVKQVVIYFTYDIVVSAEKHISHTDNQLWRVAVFPGKGRGRSCNFAAYAVRQDYIYSRVGELIGIFLENSVLLRGKVNINAFRKKL